jgi:molybdopterin molybdotransferase
VITIEEAHQRIMKHAAILPGKRVELVKTVGLKLVAAASSDMDSPPFDKSMMDGVAIRFADYDGGLREFQCVGQMLAGADSSLSVGESQCATIMTGAAIPHGADTVVMIEETKLTEDEAGTTFVITAAGVRRGQNVLLRAATMARGQTVLPAGHTVRPHDTGLLAEAGVTNCFVTPRPALAVIATGDELVSYGQIPGCGQIRNSNSPMLAAMAAGYCDSVDDLGIAPDQGDQLRLAVETGLRADILVLSGGVSAGVADLVPQVLREAGVTEVFHKVAIKPGKPLWFGVLPRGDRPACLVFGLPGNPVSSMCCFHVFVRPALLKMAGCDSRRLTDTAILQTAHRQQRGRSVFWPSRYASDPAGRTVTPLPWKGSADLLTLSEANCFAIFPGDRDAFAAGETLGIFLLD